MYLIDNTIDELCKKQPHLVMRSPDDCHRYYNCSGEDLQLTTWFYQFGFWPAKHKHECHYPFLYSEESMQCENYTKVNCGTRKEPTWACEYMSINCIIKYSLVLKSYLVSLKMMYINNFCKHVHSLCFWFLSSLF